ncbi:DUF4389 domain-containing protein [Spongisporangium articulatum]|uniref:DUF4389 domain-containing protein n=1 Tax=Spongisporangium articulatum TaxID=3362603 RepID=A0ABW8ALZ4_9ACTN
MSDVEQPPPSAAQPAPVHPLRLTGRLEQPLSRGLWLVKWLLLIPHLVILAFLWVGFAVVTVVAFFAILFTGRYPHTLFGFNRGVLRWSWRVSYYGYSALGTDRYPPFILADVPDYPARLELEYPAHLSRGLVLVKWWLLALPHYLLLAAISGGLAVAADRDGRSVTGGVSLLGVTVAIVGVSLLFRAGRYPHGLFDLLMGVNRWSTRVFVYATLMSDTYPPFRLDQGGEEPGVPGAPPAPSGGDSTAARPTSATGHVVALVLGVLLVLPGLAVAGVGGAGLWLDTQRDDAGFVSTDTTSVARPAPVVTVEGVHLDIDRAAATWLDENDLGQVRIRIEDRSPQALFVGIAPQAAVDGWLAGRAHDEITDFRSGSLRYERHAGLTPVAAPTAQSFWSASVTGTGSQQLTWRPRTGDWTLVIATADGTGAVNARAAVGAKIPSLTGVSSGLLAGGLIVLLLGVALIAWGAAGIGRGHADAQPAPPSPTPSSPAAARQESIGVGP